VGSCTPSTVRSTRLRTSGTAPKKRIERTPPAMSLSVPPLNDWSGTLYRYTVCALELEAVNGRSTQLTWSRASRYVLIAVAPFVRNMRPLCCVLSAWLDILVTIFVVL
jgi:hypothetical protein